MGEALADVICNKVPKVDMSRMEVTRFIPLHSSPQYLLERVPEVAGVFSKKRLRKFCLDGIKFFSDVILEFFLSLKNDQLYVFRDVVHQFLRIPPVSYS